MPGKNQLLTRTNTTHGDAQITNHHRPKPINQNKSIHHHRPNQSLTDKTSYTTSGQTNRPPARPITISRANHHHRPSQSLSDETNQSLPSAKPINIDQKTTHYRPKPITTDQNQITTLSNRSTPALNRPLSARPIATGQTNHHRPKTNNLPAKTITTPGENRPRAKTNHFPPVRPISTGQKPKTKNGLTPRIKNNAPEVLGRK